MLVTLHAFSAIDDKKTCIIFCDSYS